MNDKVDYQLHMLGFWFVEYFIPMSGDELNALLDSEDELDALVKEQYNSNYSEKEMEYMKNHIIDWIHNELIYRNL